MEVKSVERGSNIGSFYKLSTEERLRIVQEFSGLSDEEVQTLKTGALPGPSAQRMIENVVGVLPIPLGIAVNFLVNDKDYLDRFPFLAPAHQGLLQGHGGTNPVPLPNIPNPNATQPCQ